MRLGFALCVVTALLMGAKAPKELETLQGNWQLSSGEMNGKPLPEKELKGKITIKGAEYTLTIGDGEKVTGTQKLNTTANPKTIDIQNANGPDKGKTHLGIYEVKDDTFRVVFSAVGKPRPTKFETHPDSGEWMHVWKLVKE